MSSPACKDCAFSSLERLDPNQISTTLVCREGPGVLVVQGRTGIVMPYPVNPTYWCHRFALRAGTGPKETVDTLDKPA